MRYNHLDLNLLAALDVLIEEQSITRAAARLHMTQSATSGVLGRLRAFFDDDLLVKVGHKMHATPYALELAGPVREVLLTIRSSITAKPVFDPATSNRHFRLVMSDYLITVLFAQVIQTIRQRAPQLTFELLVPGDTTAEMLVNGEVDIVILPDHFVLAGHPSQLLFEEEHVCVVCRDNPLVGDVLTFEQYAQMGHVSVGFGRNRMLSIEDFFLSQYGFKRRIEVVTSDFNTLPQLIVGTPRIATMHRRLAELAARKLALRIVPTPVKMPVMREFMIWHRSVDRDPMHRWLREQISEVSRTVDQPVAI